MSKIVFPFALLVTLFLNNACTHYYYVPNTIQAPFLQKQHDARTSLGLIAGNQFTGWEAQATYSPLKYTAVMFNYMRVSSNRDQDVNDDWGRGRTMEVAIGGYYPVRDFATLSLFGGWGSGYSYNSYGANAVADLRFEKRFLQPGIAFQNKFVHIGTALRFTQLEYVKGKVDFEIGEPHLTTIQRIEDASPIFLPELSFNVGFGYRPFWGNLNLNFSNIDKREDFNFADFTYGISFMIEVDQLFRKKAETPDR